MVDCARVSGSDVAISVRTHLCFVTFITFITLIKVGGDQGRSMPSVFMATKQSAKAVPKCLVALAGSVVLCV